MNVINEVYDSLRWKKSDEFCSEKLGLSLEQYQDVKAQILEVKNLTREETDEMMKNIISARLLQLSNEHYDTVRKTESEILQGLQGSKEKVIEFKEDLENGTATIKGIASAEPRSPEEIIRVLKIDTNKWKLGVYWNKEQASTGLWVVSAQVSLKKPNEVTFLGHVPINI